MKVVTKEEEAAHYKATLRGGTIGGAIGLALGSAGVFWAQRRFPGFRAQTTPFKAFLIASSGTFAAIIQGDRSSAAYETQRNKDRLAFSQRVTEYERLAAQKPFLERARDWAGAHRYQIVVGSWAAAMAVALGLVRRNRFLTAQQKLVQARVYAQGLTVGVLLASFGLEARDAAGQKGRWETVRVLDPEDPEHRRLIEKRVHHERYEGEDQWIEMVEAEEQLMKERQKQHEEERRQIEIATKKAREERAHHD